VKFYLWETKHNKGPVNARAVANYELLCQELHETAEYRERYQISESEESSAPQYLKFSSDTCVQRPAQMDSATSDFRILGMGLLDTVQGKVTLPFQSTQSFLIYKNSNLGLTINVEMGEHPTGYQLAHKRFLRRIAFKAGTATLAIDLADLSLQVSDTQAGTLEVSSIVTNASEEVKSLLKMLRTESDASYRKVTVFGRLVFYCVRLPSVKNIPTAVFLTNGSLAASWNGSVSAPSGTWFNKHRFFPIASLTTF
jgi:hypothetical protein